MKERVDRYGVYERYKDELWNVEPVDDWVVGWYIACVNKITLRVDAVITLTHEKKKKLEDGGFSFRYAFDYYQTEVAPERAKRGNKQSKRVLKMDPDKYYFIECAGSGSSAWIWDEEMKVYPMFNIVTTGDRWSPEEKCFYNKKSEKKWEQYPSWIWHPENGGPHNNLLPVCYPEPPVPEPLNRGDGFDWEWVEEAVAWMNVWWRDEIDEAELFIGFYERLLANTEDLTEEEISDMNKMVAAKKAYVVEITPKAEEEEERIQKLIDAKKGN